MTEWNFDESPTPIINTTQPRDYEMIKRGRG